MRVSLLGPLEVDATEGRVTIKAAKERSLLAALALAPRSVMSTDSLIAALWGDEPPAAARKTLQTYVWHLRQALGDDVIVTEHPGYVLRVDDDAVDVIRFRTLVREGESAMRTGDVRRARSKLAEALRLWRGEPFAGVAAHTGLATEAVRLREEHLSALEARITADLADGGHAEVVAELEALVHEHPFRERLWGHLMVAQYRCGRQSDALASYQRARELLAKELGLEPGGELRRLEAAILRHDPSVAAPDEAGRVLGATLAGSAAGAVIRSPVRFARSTGGVSIAYQIAGEGPLDVLAVAGFVSHLDTWWNAPTDGLVRRLTSMGRLISFDKRGMGLSDRPELVDGLRWVDDAVAVLDAVASERAVVLGVSAGVPTAIRLAAARPDRVSALVLHCGFARQLADDDYPIGRQRDAVASFAANLERGWGSGVALRAWAPSLADDPGVRAYWARYQLLSASPASAMRYFWATVEADVRHLLPSIAVPTLVIHAERDRVVPVEQGEYLAEHIPGAELVVLDSDVHLICLSDVLDETASAIERFVAGLGEAPEREEGVRQEVLVTAVAVNAATAAARCRAARVLEQCGGRLQDPPVTATFAGPGAALRAAAQVALGADERTAVGVHCGECVSTPGGYRGSAVDVAHELARRRHRQVLVTRVVAELARDRVPGLEPYGGLSLSSGPVDVLTVSPT